MPVEESSVRKSLYKVFLLLLKFLPFLLALVSVLNTVLSYFCIDLVILSYIGSVSLLPLIFMYIAAFVFKFCIYHRIFLDYIIVSTGLAVYDYYIGIPITDTSIVTLHLVLFFIAIVIALIAHIKEKKHDEVIKSGIERPCRQNR